MIDYIKFSFLALYTILFSTKLHEEPKIETLSIIVLLQSQSFYKKQ